MSSEEALRTALFHCRNLVPEWSEESPLDAESVSGGLTNLIWKVSYPGGRSVIVRVFSEGSSLYFDRQREFVICKTLSALGIGPRVLGSWDKGRIEDFVQASPMKMQDFHQKNLLALLSVKLSGFHRIETVPKDAQVDYSVKLFKDIDEMILQAKNVQSGRFMDLLVPVECIWHDIIPKLKSLCSPVVLCHNDLNEGNLLIRRNSQGKVVDVTLIDFEYSDFNFRGYEFGNFLCESYIENNSSNTFPFFKLDRSLCLSDDLLREFIVMYLAESCGHVGEGEVDRVVVESKAFQSASHIFWACWAILQIDSSPIQWAHEEYAEQRLKAFVQICSELWSDCVT